MRSLHISVQTKHFADRKSSGFFQSTKAERISGVVRIKAI